MKEMLEKEDIRKTSRILRGGSYLSDNRYIGLRTRSTKNILEKNSDCGFRIVRTIV
jgi:hypothetical protein